MDVTDNFANEVRRIANLLVYGQSTSKEDRLMVAAARVWLRSNAPLVR
mgnify:CR=1 FL=1